MAINDNDNNNGSNWCGIGTKMMITAPNTARLREKEYSGFQTRQQRSPRPSMKP
jgi:hypothetical protein